MTGDVGTVLITGGAGFLGSLVSERLLQEGHRVLCVDNLHTGRRSNIVHLLDNPRFVFVQDDVKTFASDETFREVWNLACPASPPQYQADPVSTLMTNVVGAQRMLEIARTSHACFFQASTSEVYGDPEVHPQVETYRGAVSTTGPRACYDEGKRAAETLCYDYHRMYGVDVRVVRIFNTYGPFMDPRDGRVVSNFIVKALAGEPLEVYGDGSQTRSFCYRDDLIDGFFRVMRRDTMLPGPVNLGNPSEFTVRELAEQILALTQSSSSLSFHPLPKDDPLQRRPDISQAKQMLGWEPTVNLHEGLLRTIAHFKSLMRKAA